MSKFKIPGDDHKLERGICPNCKGESFTNATGTRYCIHCGWWDMGKTIYEKTLYTNDKVTWSLDFSKIKEDKKSAELDDRW